MLRPLLASLLGSLLLLASSHATAQTGGTTGTVSNLSKSDFSFYLQNYDTKQKSWIQMNATQQQYFFNQARCECDGDTKDYSGYFKIAIQPTAAATDKIRQLLNQNLTGSGSARLYAGGNAVNCLTPSSAPGGAIQNYCVNLINPASGATAGITGGMAAIASTNVWLSDPIPVAWLFNAATNPVCSGADCDSTAKCTTPTATVTIYFWAQTTSLQTPDATDLSFNVNLVGQSSFVPDKVTAEGVNEALTVRWTWPTGLSPSGNAAFLGVQIFCVRGADYQVFPDKTFTPAYMSSSSLCKDIVPASSVTGILAADPAYLCSGLLPSTTNEYRVTGLQNGIPYRVAVAAIDRYNNASALSTLVDATPIPTVDFYTQYTNDGGDAKGGFCAISESSGGQGTLAIAGLTIFGLALWRRRRGRRPGGGTTLLILVAGTLTAGQVQAQSTFRDDMGTDIEQTTWKGTPRSFAIEARFGLYTPAVDSEFGADDAKPHAFIFGTKRRPMWQLEFDWELFQAFGTLAVGGVIGYYKENAQACMQSTLTTTNCERSGDTTSLRLIPLAALLIYRFDVLAEHWKIPFVPYGKVGLNYTIWTITDGNGNIPSTAGGGKGQGGTTGWQAAVGISLQLDFLDSSAARGFDADAGVNHTYAFFELAHIDSSGLGSKNKLHVGDSTWFAGLMFEF